MRQRTPASEIMTQLEFRRDMSGHSVFPSIGNEVGGHTLAWQCPSAREFPSEAIQCFREGRGRFLSGDLAAALVALSRTTEPEAEFTEAHVILGLADALSSDILCANRSPGFGHNFDYASIFAFWLPRRTVAGAGLGDRCRGDFSVN